MAGDRSGRSTNGGHASVISPNACGQREETDLVPPFFPVASRPDDYQILNGETNIQGQPVSDEALRIVALGAG
jgi:hypothetical protein